MTFVKTDPKQYRYVFDLNAFPGKDYINTYEQFGWEYVGQTASCFVWRKEYTDDRPESYTDKESLVGRNKRVKNAVFVVFVLFLIGIAASLVGIGVHIYRGNTERILELSLETLLFAILATYLGWVVNQIKLNIDNQAWRAHIACTSQSRSQITTGFLSNISHSRKHILL